MYKWYPTHLITTFIIDGDLEKDTWGKCRIPYGCKVESNFFIGFSSQII